MRVTKTVREFIEKKIAEKYPYPERPSGKIQEEQARFTSIQQNIENALSAQYISKLKEAGIPVPEALHHINFYPRGATADDNFTSLWINKFTEEYTNKREVIEHKREQALTNIILTLELGGTKDVLMSMLENLPD